MRRINEQMLFTPSNLSRTDYRAKISEANTLSIRCKKELNVLESEISSWCNTVGYPVNVNEFTKDMYLSKIKPLEERSIELKAKLKQLEDFIRDMGTKLMAVW
jgi:hypothetical protein